MTQQKREDSYTVISSLSGLKVCMVAPYLPRKGGVTIQAHLMVDGLEGEGAKVTRVDTILHSLDGRLLLPLRMLLQPIVTGLRFLRRAPRCDVVHIHACSWWGFLPVLACVPLNSLFLKRRLIISFHGGAGHIWIRKCRWLAVPLLKAADAVVVVSPALQESFREYGIKAEVLRNLVALDRFPFRERRGIKPNIVWIRQFEDCYDPMTALAVYRSVKEAVPEATITFIGDGSLLGSMKRFIQEHDLKDVRFTGRVNNEDVPQEFSKADVFLNTSRYDGLPTALLEASTSGLPIVTTNPGGIPDMMKNGIEGIVVPVGDVTALASEVIGLIRDPERAARIGRAAHENAQAYSWQVCAQALAKLYRPGAHSEAKSR